MGWGNITGDEQLIPSNGSNEVILESGKVKKVRLLLQSGEEPYSFFQHTMEVERVENGQTVRTFRTVNCAKTKKTPYANCPLCNGQQLQRRIRHAAPVWDYDTQSVKFLTGGQSIWEPIVTLKKMGIDPSTVDFAIMRSGQGRNDTSYSVQNMGASAFVLPEGTVIPNAEDEYRSHSEDEMKSMVESLGMVWANVIVPPPLKYQGSLQEALSHIVPNGKYKNQTMQQIWDTNRGMVEYFANSNRITPEKSAAQIIMVALGGASIEGVPNYSGGSAQNPAQTTVQPAPNPAAPTPTPTQPAPAQSGDKQLKINKINTLLASPKIASAGYNKIIDLMKSAGNGKTQIAEFSDAELDTMIKLCEESAN